MVTPARMERALPIASASQGMILKKSPPVANRTEEKNTYNVGKGMEAFFFKENILLSAGSASVFTHGSETGLGSL